MAASFSGVLIGGDGSSAGRSAIAGAAIRFSSKKIKRPGLVLKTPIACKGDRDPSVIQRNGMGRFCFKRNKFYTKK